MSDSIVTMREVHHRIDFLAALKPGWAGETMGERYPLSCLLRVQDALLEHRKLGGELPFIYPVVDGGLRLEWLNGRGASGLLGDDIWMRDGNSTEHSLRSLLQELRECAD